jgi:hypothetical protein
MLIKCKHTHIDVLKPVGYDVLTIVQIVIDPSKKFVATSYIPRIPPELL